MKLFRFRSTSVWDLESHEAWLSAQARKGLHYRWRFVVLDRFNAGAPGEFAFCWDRCPALGGKGKATYLNARQAAGWEKVAESAGMVCWRRAVVAGQPQPVLRDAQETRRMLNGIANTNVLMAVPVAAFTALAFARLLSGDLVTRPLHALAAGLGTLALALAAYTVVRLKSR